ncbi:hypothetical protein T4A_295 [Trichinella pseudospiralis]|uniref:Uncharacterized protein n=1 Tax=Trichinella pseudospiralis TaxID=6337 RepID=A0A0V1CAN2_TRIPS|nr:hypothetical protein T4A_295 [Trichinella pseudospiralis]
MELIPVKERAYPPEIRMAGHRYGCLSFEQWSAERKEMHGWSTVC